MNVRSLTRRQFLIGGGVLGAAGAIGAGLWRSHDDGPGSTGTGVSRASGNAAAKEHVLVVVQLGGGNDALNTVVPLDGRYHDARPSLALTDDALVPMTGTTTLGLHASLAPWKPLLEAGHVAAVAGIGFEHPDRSHFVALDDWWAGSTDRAATTGWLGRYLDATRADHESPLRAVELGGGTPAFSAEHTSATVVNDVAGFSLRAPHRMDRAALVDAWERLAPAHAAAADAVNTFGRLADLAGPAVSGSPITKGGGGRDGELSDLLAVAAALVREEPAVRVVQVVGGGFDTHAAQADVHKALLADLGTGVATFFDTLDHSGDADRVVLVTVSEFGRRVAENGSGGTDHGKAGVQFVIGPAVRGGVYGEYDLGALDDGDLPPRVEPGSLYTLAVDWLGGPVDDVLSRRYDRLGIL